MKHSFSRRLLLTAGLAVAAMAGTVPAFAQSDYPARPVTIVIPFPPGGSTDLLARKIGEELSRSLGQPFVVENLGGAGGAVGANNVAQSSPDGYRLLMGVTGSNAISAALRSDLPYDPVEDFAPVSIVVSAPLALVVNADSDFNSTQDVIDYATENPELFTYGTPGVGTSMHMTGELFGLETGTQLTHVPYGGSAQALQDLLSGSIDAMFGDILVTQEHVKAGTLRALSVTSAERHFLMPDAPTIAEDGVEGFNAVSWQGLFAPAGTPQDILDTLYEAVVEAIASDDMQAFFEERGFIVDSMPPAESAAFVAEEVAKWKEVVAEAGVTVN